MKKARLCSRFINRRGGYRPLACQPITMRVRDIRGTSWQNKSNFYGMAMATTFKENAHLDLVLRVPRWVHFVRQGSEMLPTIATRVTSAGDTRVTTGGATRIAEVPPP